MCQRVFHEQVSLSASNHCYNYDEFNKLLKPLLDSDIIRNRGTAKTTVLPAKSREQASLCSAGR